MALERHVVEFSARDQLSATLENVGRKADEAGKKAETAAKRATTSTTDWNKAAAAVGAGLGLAFGAAIKLANESEVVQSRLQQSVENTGVSYDTLASKIDAAASHALDLGFDDEDALNALNTLTNASGDAEQALRDLATAEDLARGMGISLGQAASIIAAAETGRIGNLRRMGIQIDANATKEEALAALQTRFAGQAEEYAQTNAATWDRFGNSVENALEGLGGKLADIQGPLVALGGAGAAIGPLGDAFDALGGKAKLAQLGTSALSVALGPVGLIGFAATAAAGIAYLALTQEDSATAAEQAAAANQTLTNALADQASALDRLGLLSAAEALTDTTKQLGENAAIAQGRIDTVVSAQNKWVESSYDLKQAQEIDDDIFKGLDQYTREVADAADGARDGMITFEGLNAALTTLGQGFTDTAVNSESFSSTLNSVIELATRSDLNGAQILSDAQDILNQLGTGAISAEQAEAALNGLVSNYAQYSTVLDGVTDAQQKQIDSLNDLAERGLENARKRLADLATQLGVMPDLLDAMAESGNQAAIAARNIGDSGSALDSVTRIIIGNTDAIGQNSQSLADWAEGMKGTGADAEALNTILTANESIQGDILEIQAKQAPILADLAASQAAYIDTLANLPADQQLAALAMMDTATAAQAQELTMLAASAAAGELGAQGTAMAESLIIGAAKANPGLAAILENMGLINATDGEITVNFPNATSLADTLQSLQDALTDLVTATYMLIVAADPDDAYTDIAGVKAAIEGLPDGTVNISADTTSFWNMIGGIPQVVGDRYVNVHGVGFTSDAFALGGVTPWPDTAALGRVTRGNMTLVGEHGPELVNLPGGSLVTPNHATRYRPEVTGGPGIVIQQMTVVANDPQQFMRQMRSYTATMHRS